MAGQPFNEVDYSATSTMTAILGRMASYSGQLVTWDEAMKSQLDLSPKRLAWDAEPPVLPGPNGEYPTPVPGMAKALLTDPAGMPHSNARATFTALAASGA